MLTYSKYYSSRFPYYISGLPPSSFFLFGFSRIRMDAHHALHFAFGIFGGFSFLFLFLFPPVVFLVCFCSCLSSLKQEMLQPCSSSWIHCKYRWNFLSFSFFHAILGFFFFWFSKVALKGVLANAHPRECRYICTNEDDDRFSFLFFSFLFLFGQTPYSDIFFHFF